MACSRMFLCGSATALAIVGAIMAIIAITGGCCDADNCLGLDIDGCCTSYWGADCKHTDNADHKDFCSGGLDGSDNCTTLQVLLWGGIALAVIGAVISCIWCCCTGPGQCCGPPKDPATSGQGAQMSTSSA